MARDGGSSADSRARLILGRIAARLRGMSGMAGSRACSEPPRSHGRAQDAPRGNRHRAAKTGLDSGCGRPHRGRLPRPALIGTRYGGLGRGAVVRYGRVPSRTSRDLGGHAPGPSACGSADRVRSRRFRIECGRRRSRSVTTVDAQPGRVQPGKGPASRLRRAHDARRSVESTGATKKARRSRALRWKARGNRPGRSPGVLDQKSRWTRKRNEDTPSEVVVRGTKVPH